MAGPFGYDSLLDLKVELEQIKETLKGENGLALLKELQTELLFRWMIFDDAMSDQILGISENQYVQVLTGSDAVDHFVLSRLSPAACPADLESEPFPKKRTRKLEKKWNDSDTQIKRRKPIAYPQSVRERASLRRNEGVPCCRMPLNRQTHRSAPPLSWNTA